MYDSYMFNTTETNNNINDNDNHHTNAMYTNNKHIDINDNNSKHEHDKLIESYVCFTSGLFATRTLIRTPTHPRMHTRQSVVTHANPYAYPDAYPDAYPMHSPQHTCPGTGVSHTLVCCLTAPCLLQSDRCSYY